MAPPSTTFDFNLLRDLRKRAGMTMEQVSEQSGISVAVISKLERNQSLAELETLYRLGRVYGMSASDLLRLAESPYAQRAGETAHSTSGFKFRQIRYGNVRAMSATAASGDRISRPEIHRDDHEVCWVLKGSLKIRLPNEEIVLERGDSLQFDAALEHTYEALDDCELVILHLRKEGRF